MGPKNVTSRISKAVESTIGRPAFNATEASVKRKVKINALNKISGMPMRSLMPERENVVDDRVMGDVVNRVCGSLRTWDGKLRVQTLLPR